MGLERWLCLEFTHTVGWRERDRPDDRLADYGALVEWVRERGALDRENARALLDAAARRPDHARAVHARAIVVREAVYAIFVALGEGRAPGAERVEALNAELAAAGRRRRVDAVDGGYAWTWASTPDLLDRPLWPVVWSAAELLAEGPLDRVRRCAADDCGWLFVDASRNRSRRWCDMSDCGNRAKVRRYRERRGA